MPRVRNEDNLNCPYCGTKQENLYGSGSDCSSCGKYFKIGFTNGGYTSLWKVTANLKYRVIRDEYKKNCNQLDEFILNKEKYFKSTRIDFASRNIVVKYAYNLGMKVGQIEKYHKENGSSLCSCTIKKILNLNENGK